VNIIETRLVCLFACLFCSSVVPLGKILEYLQEDYEMMAKEMLNYNDEYKQAVTELRKEKL
jgi:hypothetical protein